MTSLMYAPKDDSTISKLLTAWTKAVQRYDTVLGPYDDCCWWYNERANISVLAGAAWTEGWVALEECGIVKRVEDDLELNRAIQSKGRLDLYISTETEHFAFEAKMAWQGLNGFTPRNPCIEAVKKRLSDARKDARKLVDEADRHFAATFIAPFFESANCADSDLSQYQGVLNQWLDSLRKCISNDRYLMAYVFPKLDQRRFINIENALFPGIVLILEQVS